MVYTTVVRHVIQHVFMLSIPYILQKWLKLLLKLSISFLRVLLMCVGYKIIARKLLASSNFFIRQNKRF